MPMEVVSTSQSGRCKASDSEREEPLRGSDHASIDSRYSRTFEWRLTSYHLDLGGLLTGQWQAGEQPLFLKESESPPSTLPAPSSNRTGVVALDPEGTRWGYLPGYSDPKFRPGPLGACPA